MRTTTMLNAIRLRSRSLYLLCFLCMVRIPLSAFAATPPDATSVILIQNATVMTVSHGTIEHGSILIKDGKIAEVGQFIKAPAGAQVIDASGQFVIPGIIDCHSHIEAESINESSVSVSSMMTMEEVLNPDDINLYPDLADGVTTANILHSSANSLRGHTHVINLRCGPLAYRLTNDDA